MRDSDPPLAPHAAADDQGTEPATGPPRAVLRWFRLAGLPVVAVLLIATAILLLRPHDGGSGGAIALDQSLLPSDGSAGVAPEEGAIAPDFALTAADGRVYRLSDLRGHPVMINFWATWCGPCKSEMPAIDAVYHAHEADGLIVLAVNVRETWSQITPYVTKLGLAFPVLLDGNGSVSGRYRVHALPTTYLITRDGRVSGSREGAYTRAMLSGRIEQLLDEP
jgi:thiol-disulfide isomerase/thioredoxin